MRTVLVATVASGWLLSFSLTAQTADFSGTTDDSIRNVLKVVADRQLRTTATGTTPRNLTDGDYTVVATTNAAHAATRPGGIEWNYPWGVNLYGLMQTYRATGNTNYLNFVLKHNLIIGRYYFWLRSLHNSLTSTTGLAAFQQATALRETFLNDTSSGKLDYCGSATSQMMEGVLNYSDATTFEQLQFALNTAKYISTTQARLPDGTLYRPERDYTIWADDLYMSCPFLVRWYQYTGDTKFLDDAVLQITNMAGYLQDADGIWYHGYYNNTASVNGFKWGRANGWAMVATTEVLSVMPTNHPARSIVLDILVRHIDGIKSVQTTNGMWRQVLDEPTLWEETSCTAMFSYCIARAVNRGWIDLTNMTVARNGFAGVCKNITTNGVVNGTCTGTGIGTTLDFYISRTRPTDDMHGRGAVMLAGAEILLHPQLDIEVTETNVALSWPAGARRCALQTTTDFADWSPASGTTTTNSAWHSVMTVVAGDMGFYRLHIEDTSYPLSPVIVEAESLSWITNGAAAQLSSSDTNASGNHFVTLFGDSSDDYIEFTLPAVPAGKYRLKMNFKSNTNRGYVNLLLDGSPQGGTLDEYFYSIVYPVMDFGEVNFASTGDHTLRFTVGGKHGASSGYTFTADSFILVPQ